MTQTDFSAILPLIVVLGAATLLLLLDLWLPRERKSVIPLLAAAALAAALGIALPQSGQATLAFNGMAVLDGFASYLIVIFLFSGLVGIALAYDYLKRMGIARSEYYVLLLFSVGGMMLMAYANDLIVVFLALELLSIPLYVLAGFAHPRLDSEEASLKYFLLGAFSSGFVLYGVALVFGATGQTGLNGIVAAVTDGSANPALLLAGAALLLVGLGFKMAAAPFHMWAPDVYQGAPTPVSGFMSVAVKAAAVAALLRVFVVAFPSLAASLTPALWVLSALTMIVGNLLALAQENVKRLLAYSSIANAGYLLSAFVVYGDGEVVGEAVAAMLFFLIAYALTSFGAWAVVIDLERAEGRGLALQDYAGLGRRYPVLALAMLCFMLSFTGIPPTLGFWGKFYLFRAAVAGGYSGLALIGLLTSLLSAYYYLRLVVIMYMQPGEPLRRNDAWSNLTAVVMALAVVLLSFAPGTLLNLAMQAVLRLQ